MSLIDNGKTESKIKEQTQREKNVKMQCKEELLIQKKSYHSTVPKCHTATFACLFTRNVRVECLLVPCSAVSDCSVHC